MRDQEDEDADRRGHVAALAVLGRCIRRREVPGWMWRNYDVFACDFDDALQAVA